MNETQNQNKSNKENESSNAENANGTENADEVNDIDTLLWKSRKISKSKYLFEFFDCVNTNTADKKLNASCKLCKSTLTISKGNNSNLLKHMRNVSYSSSYLNKMN